MHYSTHQEIGDRNTQQDRLCVHRIGPFLLAAVFDGHGGEQAAEFASTQFPICLSDDLHELDAKPALKNAISHLVDALKDEYSGTTLTAALIDEAGARVTLAVLGDSPALVFQPDSDTPYCPPQHNLSLCPNDAEAIRALGLGRISEGYIWDHSGDRGVNLTRALGDAAFRDLLIRDPHITTLPFPSGSLLLIGSDGVRLNRHSEDYAERLWTGYRTAARLARSGATACELVAALKAQAQPGEPLDNVTAIAINA